jgi:hypothetical protein
VKNWKLFLLVPVLLTALSADASAYWKRTGGGSMTGGTAVREGRSSDARETNCLSCSGQADYKVGVCYRQHPGHVAGCNRAKETWQRNCIRTCKTNH